MFTYSLVCRNDLPDLIKLYRGYLNDGDAIDRYIRGNFETDGYIAVKCVCDGKTVGVISANKGLEFTCGHEDLIEKIYKELGNKDIYCGEMLAVLPEFRNQGIAKGLAQRLAEELKEKKARYLVLEEWQRSIEHDTPANGIVKYLGTSETVCIDPEFYKDLAKYGLTCPQCGQNCTCGAKVIIITLAQ